MLRISLAFSVAALLACLVDVEAHAKVPPDEWVRIAVLALGGTRDAGSVKGKLEALPGEIATRTGEKIERGDLGLDEVLAALSSVSNDGARAFASRAAGQCGILAPRRGDSFRAFLRKVGRCLLDQARSATAPARPSDEGIPLAVRRLLGAAATGARALVVALEAEAARTRARFPDLFSADLVASARTATDADARAFSRKAHPCASLAPAADEETTAYAGRVGACVRDAFRAVQAEARFRAVRAAVHALVDAASRGAASLRRAVVAGEGVVPAPLASLLPGDIRAALAKLGDAEALAFARLADACTLLVPSPGESLEAFTARAGECIAGSVSGGPAKTAESVIGKALARLLEGARRGASGLKKALEPAIGDLGTQADPESVFPPSVRSTLEKPSPLVAAILLKKGRRCQSMRRRAGQTHAAFARAVGDCLEDVLREAGPGTLVVRVLRAVRELVTAAPRGAPALRQALGAVDRDLRHVVPTGELFTPALRQAVLRADAAWLQRFVKLATPCQHRAFKKHHRFDEFLLRVGLCLEAAARGITPEVVENEMRAAVRAISSAGRQGARLFRHALDEQTRSLSRIMRVNDLFPEAWRKAASTLDDSSTRAFSVAAAACAEMKRGDRGLGPFAKALATCLEDALRQSGGGALAARVREAIRALVDRARQGAAALRGAVPAASRALQGMIPVEALFTDSLKRGLTSAAEPEAAAFARTAGKCAEIQFAEGSVVGAYLEEVARCLVTALTGASDAMRGAQAHAAVEKLAELADAGAAELQRRFGAVAASAGSALPLSRALVQRLDFDARAQAFSDQIRKECLPLPATTPVEIRRIQTCLERAAARAARIPPPDACREKEGQALFDCCMLGNNRQLPSCFAHRQSCRPGEIFQGGACVRATCQPGFQPGPDGSCQRVGCAPGTAQHPQGPCVPLRCAPGFALDPLNRCVRSHCPAGTSPDALGRCAAGNCPPGHVPTAWGQCVRIDCPMGTTSDSAGRCVIITCPIGMMMSPAGQCMWVTCPPGTQLMPSGECAPVLCPPGMTLGPMGACIPLLR